MHGCTVYVKEGLLIKGIISRKLRAFLLVFFLLYQSPSSSLCTVFDAISSNIDEFLSVNPSANVFVFGDFKVHHKDCLTHSGGTDGLVNYIMIFLSQMTLFWW